MAKSTASLRTGVAGWNHTDWDHCLYPSPQPRNFHPLRFLARRVDVVEADSTFLEIPRPETTALWASHVAANPDFRFTVRLHRDFTHERSLAPARLEAFHEALRPLTLARRLGCVVMQFPASFRFTPENRNHLIQLRRALHQYPLVAELRHRSWAADEALGTLVDYHVGIANLDQPAASFAMEPASRLTSPVAYFKFHGRAPIDGHYDFDDRAARPAQPYLYTLAELEAWQRRIDYARRFAREVCVIFANSAAGCSMTNSLQLASLLEGQRAEPRRGAGRPMAAPLLPFRAA